VDEDGPLVVPDPLGLPGGLVVGGSGQDDPGAGGLHGPALDRVDPARHADRGRDPGTTGHVGHGPAVVPAGARHHAPLPLPLAQGGDPGGGPPDLEGAGDLEVLGLEEHLPSQPVREEGRRQEGRPDRHGVDGLPDPLNVQGREGGDGGRPAVGVVVPGARSVGGHGQKTTGPSSSRRVIQSPEFIPDEKMLPLKSWAPHVMGQLGTTIWSSMGISRATSLPWA